MLPADMADERNLVMMFAAPALAVVVTLALSGLAYVVTPVPVVAEHSSTPTRAALPAPVPLSPSQAALVATEPGAIAPAPAVAPEAPTADTVLQTERLASLGGAVKGYPVIRRMVDHAMTDGRLDEAEYHSIDRRLARIKRNQAERNRRRARNRRH